MATNRNLSKGLSGVGNKAYHQYIISDLIFGVRKKLVKDKKASKLSVLSEISLSQIGNKITNDNFSKDHNIDFVVMEEHTKNLLFIAEIESAGANLTRTNKKIEECLSQMPSIKEAYIIKFDEEGKTTFEICTLEKKKLKRTEVNSKSEFLGIILKSILVSTRK